MPDPVDDDAVSTPADMLAKLTELGTKAQSAVLEAEMQVLAHMMTGLAGGAEPPAPATDAEVESGFDNMPI